MRLALLTPEHPAIGPSFGVGSYSVTQASALEAIGVAGTMVVASATGCHVIEAGTIRRIAQPPPPLALARPWFLARAIRSVLDDVRPDVVEAPNWGGLAVTVPDAWPLVVRLVTPVTTITASSLLRRCAQHIHHRHERRSVVRADVVIASSDSMDALSLRTYGRGADVIVPHAWSGTLRNLERTSRHVLAVGRLEHRKGTDVLLEAWAQVAMRHPGAILHLVGADSAGFGAHALARFGREQVMVHGLLSEAALDDVRRDCLIQVIPSRYESFGLVALEAWAAGMCVVASRCGGLAEVVGDAGILVEPEDAQKLAAALTAALADTPRCRDLADVGRRRLVDRFSTSVCSPINRAAYQLAIERHQRLRRTSAAPAASTST